MDRLLELNEYMDNVLEFARDEEKKPTRPISRFVTSPWLPAAGFGCSRGWCWSESSSSAIPWEGGFEAYAQW